MTAKDSSRCGQRLILLLLLAATLAVKADAGPRIEVRHGGTQLAIELSPELRRDADGGPWGAWLHTALRASSTATGRYPRRRVRVELRAAPSSHRTIAFGQVRRERPPRIVFWVDPEADLTSLRADWRSYHEFAHLLIPFPGNRDIWFTEGFASYYQYLLQSRAGLITERDAWTRLLAGFRRGVRDPAGRGRTLRALSPDMWREDAFRRVYWTGAAFFLRVDVRLRAKSGGQHSLDRTLARFHECCLRTGRRWRAAELIERLGSLSIASIWREEYERIIDQPAEPDIDPVLRQLGIDNTGTSPVFSDAVEARRLRHAIAGPRAARADQESEAVP
jgi:hypothetical protein